MTVFNKNITDKIFSYFDTKSLISNKHWKKYFHEKEKNRFTTLSVKNFCVDSFVGHFLKIRLPNDSAEYVYMPRKFHKYKNIKIRFYSSGRIEVLVTGIQMPGEKVLSKGDKMKINKFRNDEKRIAKLKRKAF